jgi:UDP-glucose 4-epimerase
MVRKWFVTGGCGFIGLALTRNILECFPEDRIRIFDNLSVGSVEDLSQTARYSEVTPQDLVGGEMAGERCELVIGDIREAELLACACQDADVVVHLAASTGVPQSVANPVEDCMSNVIGTLNALEAARLNNIRRFVFASSGAPVGSCIPPVHEELPCHPVSPYGASKLAGEAYCSAYKHSYDIDTVGLRFSNVYGPGSMAKSSVVAKFIRNGISDGVLEIYGDGSQTRDFIYVDDLVRAIVLSAGAGGLGGNVFQIATQRGTSINELVDIMSRIFSSRGLRKVEVKHGSERLGDVKFNYADISKARKMLNWSPETDLEQGLEKTVDFFKARLL